MNYSLRHGISHLSASGFVLYGLCLGAVFGNFRAGYGFGRLAVDLAESERHPAVLCKVLVIFALFIKYWRDPIADSLPMIERARTLALQAEDHQYVNYAIIGRLSLDFSRGVRLTELDAYCAEHDLYVHRSNDAFPIEAFMMWKSSVLALTGRTDAGYSLSHDAYDEQAAEQRYHRTRNLTLLAYQYTLRTQLAYLFGRAEEALALSKRAQAVIASRARPDHGRVTIISTAGWRRRRELRAHPGSAPRLQALVWRCLRRLRRYAANSPQNFLPYLRLLEAEFARARGRPHAALRLFNQAADLAEAQQLRQIVGLANERAALCLLEDGQARTAASHLTEAKAAYADWGASAKVAALETQFADLLGPASQRHTATGPAQSQIDPAAATNPDLISAGLRRCGSWPPRSGTIMCWSISHGSHLRPDGRRIRLRLATRGAGSYRVEGRCAGRTDCACPARGRDRRGCVPGGHPELRRAHR